MNQEASQVVTARQRRRTERRVRLSYGHGEVRSEVVGRGREQRQGRPKSASVAGEVR